MTRGVRLDSPRMFQSELIERFSRAHPLTPAVLYLPVIAVSVYQALGQHGFGSVLFGVFAGYLLWTVSEYWLHRTLFHLPIVGPKTARLAFLVHGVHHEAPWDETRLVMPAGASVGLAVLTYFGFRGALGADQMWAPFAGFVLGYVIYDEVHWYIHACRPTSRLGRWLRREHFLHHFHDSNSRFGVSCPWLDFVFRSRGSKPRRRTAGRSSESLEPAE